MKLILLLLLFVFSITADCKSQELKNFLDGKFSAEKFNDKRYLPMYEPSVYKFNKAEIREKKIKRATIMMNLNLGMDVDPINWRLSYDTLSEFLFDTTGFVTDFIDRTQGQHDTIHFSNKKDERFQSIEIKGKDSTITSWHIDTDDASMDTLGYKEKIYREGRLLSDIRKMTSLARRKHGDWFDNKGMDYHYEYKYNQQGQLSEIKSVYASGNGWRDEIEYKSNGKIFYTYDLKSDTIRNKSETFLVINENGSYSETRENSICIFKPVKPGSDLPEEIIIIDVGEHNAVTRYYYSYN